MKRMKENVTISSTESSLMDGYCDLYRALASTAYRHPPGGIGVHIPIEGLRYRAADHGIRFMLIGRATNGWPPNDLSVGEEAFALGALQALKSHSRMLWQETAHLHPEQAERTEPLYSLTRSAFWRTARRIYGGLAKLDTVPIDWMENIAWGNLYAAAPHQGNNPSQTLCRVQREACRKLLSAYLEWFDPTHVLLVCGYDWFKDMAQHGSDPVLPNVERIVDCESVCGMGVEKGRKVIVMNRPEGKNEEAAAREVCGCFGECEC